MKSFSMRHIIFRSIDYFDEDNAPKWLKYGGLKGSTMDNRWFWNDHILTLSVGESKNTDFHVITRIS